MANKERIHKVLLRRVKDTLRCDLIHVGIGLVEKFHVFKYSA